MQRITSMCAKAVGDDAADARLEVSQRSAAVESQDLADDKFLGGSFVPAHAMIRRDCGAKVRGRSRQFAAAPGLRLTALFGACSRRELWSSHASECRYPLSIKFSYLLPQHLQRP
ncbi:unnamed protein product [Symbiodinium sp. CCMP2592]|nr:unnamed protein product [Symbiodinium sp. CCMP2592]